MGLTLVGCSKSAWCTEPKGPKGRASRAAGAVQQHHGSTRLPLRRSAAAHQAISRPPPRRRLKPVSGYHSALPQINRVELFDIRLSSKGCELKSIWRQTGSPPAPEVRAWRVRGDAMEARRPCSRLRDGRVEAPHPAQRRCCALLQHPARHPRQVANAAPATRDPQGCRPATPPLPQRRWTRRRRAGAPGSRCPLTRSCKQGLAGACVLEPK